jgi:hypothetical protein
MGFKDLSEIKNYEEFQSIDLTKTFTAEEFELFQDCRIACELIHGKIIERSIGWYWESEPRNIIGKKITLFYLDDKLEIGMGFQNFYVQLSQDTVTLASYVFFNFSHLPKSEWRKHFLTEDITPGLVVEILPPLRKRQDWEVDLYQEKVRMYQAIGVSITWLVDLEANCVEVYHPQDRAPQILGLNGELDGENVIPGLRIPVAAILPKDLREFLKSKDWD